MKIIHVKKKWLILITLLSIFVITWIINIESQVEQVEIIQNDDIPVKTSEMSELSKNKEMKKTDETLNKFLEKKQNNEAVNFLPPEKQDDWELDDNKDFFVEYRLQRDRVRSKEIEKMNQLLDNPNVSQGAKEQVETELLNLMTRQEKELTIENLVRANGFEDAIFFYSDGAANIVVKSENLSESEVIQITEIVSENANVSKADIKVVQHR